MTASPRTTNSPLAALRDEERLRLENWLLRFDQGWNPEALDKAAAELAQEPAEYRLAALVELVKIDLEQSRMRGLPRPLGQYLARFPELAGKEIESQLIAAEQLLSERAAGETDRSVVARNTLPAPAQQTVLPQRLQSTAADWQVGDFPRPLGKYRLLEPLGKGAMGAVFLAEDTQLERRVAVKLPRFDAEGDNAGQMLERFYREARAAATLRHPNICPVYEVGEVEGQHFIAMAYIEGKKLSEFIDPEKPLPERQVLLAVRKLALAVQEAHDHGIVHRDLKPANVMVDRRGEPIVMDFGLAARTQTTDAARLTQSGLIVGSPAYMSPEQAQGEISQIGPAADQYSLGVMLFELLTGRLPFRGSLTAILTQIVTKPPPKPSELRTGIDPRTEALCLKMMAKEISGRYPSLKVVAQEIGTILKTVPALPLPLTKGESEGVLPAAAPLVADAAGLSKPAAPVPDVKEAPGPQPDPSKKPAAVARTEAGSVSQQKKPSRADLSALATSAQQLIARHDYAQAADLLQGVPAEQRTPQIQDLLQQANDSQEEFDLLWEGIKDAVARKRVDGIEPNVRRLLELKPGHKPAKQILAALQTYRRAPKGKRKFRFDEQGKLLPASDSIFEGWQVAAGIVVGAFLLTTLAVVMYLRSDGQTVAIEVDDKLLADGSVTLSISGKTVEIKGLGETITLKAGPHQYEVRRGDAVIVQPAEFVVKKGEKNVLRIGLAAGEVAAATAAPAGEWLEIIPAVDPVSDVLEVEATGNNTWEHKEGALRYVPDGKGGKLKLPVEVNGEAWELIVEVSGLQDQAEFVLDLPTKTGTLIVQFHRDWTGLRGDRMNKGVEISSGQRRTILVRRERGEDDHLLVTVDGAEWIDWHGDISTRVAPFSFSLLDGKSMGLFVPQKGIAFHSVRLKMLEGTARLLRPAGGTAAPPSGGGGHSWPADAPAPAIAPFDTAQAKKHQQAWADYLKLPVEHKNSIGMKFVLIPPGEFTMGSTPAEIEEALKTFNPDNKHGQACIRSEAPPHKVILTRPVYVGIHEVTQKEYAAVMGTNPSHFSTTGPGKDAVAGIDTQNHPVESVSWNDAAEFCAKLSQQEKLLPFYSRTGETVTLQKGTGYRLPTEAEWEFACRAGTATKFWTGPSDESLVQAGWIRANSGGRTHAVGELQANPLGLFDIHGGLWEWVQDGWDPQYYGKFAEQPAIDPSGPSTGDFQRVIRGGSVTSPAPDCRSSQRNATDPTVRGDRLGFRVVLVADAVKQSLSRRSQGGPAQPAGTAIDLLALIDPDRHSKDALWKKDGSDLVSPPNKIPNIQSLDAPIRPRGSFRLDLEVTREQGDGTFGVTFPVAETRGGVWIAWNRNQRVGIAKGAGTLLMAKPHSMTNGQKHGFQIEVRPNAANGQTQITIAADGKTILDWTGPTNELRVPDRTGGVQSLQFKSADLFRFHKATLTMLDGTAEMLETPPAPPAVANSGPVTGWPWTWSEPTAVGPFVDAAYEAGIASGPGDLSILFGRSVPSGATSLWQAKRSAKTDRFGSAVMLENVNSGVADGCPTLSADGLTVIFDSFRDKQWDLWTARRPTLDAPFGAPSKLPGPIDTAAAEATPSLTADGLALYFHSDRALPNNGLSIWASTRATTTDEFGAPVALGPNVNAGGMNGDPAISPDGRVLVFYSDRGGGAGANDLWMSARQPDGTFGPAVNLGPKINTADREGKPSFSADGQSLYFISKSRGNSIWVARREAATGAANDRGWNELFNGRDLTGWRVDGNPSGVTARDGVMTVGGAIDGWVATTRAYADFELELDYKLAAGGDCGVFLRIADDAALNGGDFLQVQFRDEDAPAFQGAEDWSRSGGVFGVLAPTVRTKSAAGIWHALRVKAVGSEITISIDDQQVASGNVATAKVLSPKPIRHLLRASGPIALQRRQQPTEFRNIRVRELPGGAAGTGGPNGTYLVEFAKDQGWSFVYEFTGAKMQRRFVKTPGTEYRPIDGDATVQRLEGGKSLLVHQERGEHELWTEDQPGTFQIQRGDAKTYLSSPLRGTAKKLSANELQQLTKAATK